MKEIMIKNENEYISYKELLIVDSNAEKRTCDVIGISNNGDFILIKEEEVNVGNSYFLEKHFFILDKDEYNKYLGIAVKNARLQQSISKGTTILEVCYKGKYFKAGSSIKYIVTHRECSIFTDDREYAEENDFNRIDKFEYEKTIHIEAMDSIRITQKDANSGESLVQQEMKPAEFTKWIDTL